MLVKRSAGKLLPAVAKPQPQPEKPADKDKKK